MHPDEALAQIRVIRSQLARTGVYRGIRAAPVAATAVLAQGAALLQPLFVDAPHEHPGIFTLYWSATAAVAAGILATHLVLSYRSASAPERASTRSALALFLPPIAAAALVTPPLAARGAFDLLPGLWAVFTGIALFAVRPMLPRATGFVALGYVGAGAACLLFLRGAASLSPWVMGTIFSAGQLAAAAALYWNLERPRHEAERA